MTRHRWLRAHWPFDMQMLTQRLRSIPFTAQAHNGFIIDKFRPEIIEGRFIERQEINQIVENPLGEKVNYQRTEFRYISFIFSNNPSYIEIINPPRSMGLFLSRLGEACDFLISVEEVKIDVDAWCKAFADRGDLHFEVISCQFGNIRISSDIIATAIVKGGVDVRNASNLFVEGYQHTVEKIKIRISSPFQLTLILTKNGSVIFDGNYYFDFLVYLRQSLFLKKSQQP